MHTVRVYGMCTVFDNTVNVIYTYLTLIYYSQTYVYIQALFRPITVMVPDLVLICENMLMAEGFTQAKVGAITAHAYRVYILLCICVCIGDMLVLLCVCDDSVRIYTDIHMCLY